MTNIGPAHPAFEDGTAIQTEWNTRRRYWINKKGARLRNIRPNNVADPPIPEVLAQQPVLPPVLDPPVQDPEAQDLAVQDLAVQDAVVGDAVVEGAVVEAAVQDPVVGDEPLQDRPIQDAPTHSISDSSDENEQFYPANELPTAPASPDTLAGGSPPYVLVNTAADLDPSRGQTAHVRDDMRNQGWKFARVLVQSKLKGEFLPRNDGTLVPMNEMALNPLTNVLLYVRTDEAERIVDVSIQECFLPTIR